VDLSQVIDNEAKQEKRDDYGENRSPKDVAVPIELPKRILFRRQKSTAKMRHEQQSSKRPLEKSLAPVCLISTRIVAKEPEAK
jgi:hypothetical protein